MPFTEKVWGLVKDATADLENRNVIRFESSDDRDVFVLDCIDHFSWAHMHQNADLNTIPDIVLDVAEVEGFAC